MILVTGAAGLLGWAVVKQLEAAKQQVVALYSTTPLPQHNGNYIIPRQASILDVIALQDAMQGCTHIIHCAGKVSFAGNDAALLYKINVEGTANVVNCALAAGIHKLVHISSVAALGRIRNHAVITETMQWTAATSNSEYGRTKYLGELEVWRGIAEGLQATILNPSIILGCGSWHTGSSQIFKTYYNNFGWYTTGSTGWVDVQDVAAISIQVLQPIGTNERYIVSGHNATYQAIFTMIAKAFNKKIPTHKVTPLVAGIVWRWEWLKQLITGKAPLITKETASTALTHVTYDGSKLLGVLPNYKYTALEHTISDICSAYLCKLNA